MINVEEEINEFNPDHYSDLKDHFPMMKDLKK